MPCVAAYDVPMMDVSVVLTDAAAGAVQRVREELGDELTLLIGNGCCDSTAPFLFSRYAPGPAETRVGEVAGVPVYLDAALVDLFEGREVVIDVRDDPGGDSFSAETELGLRFTMERLPLPSWSEAAGSAPQR
jgi:uncharacterized protein (DUF779 family)